MAPSVRSIILLAVGSATCAAVATVLWRQRKNASHKLPPIAPVTPWEVVKKINAPTMPLYVLQLGRQMNIPVFRLRLPLGLQAYIIQDANLAQTILRNSDNEKTPIYHLVDQVTCGRPSLPSLETNSYKWQTKRKEFSRAFAPSLLAKKSGFLEQGVSELCAVLEEHADKGLPVDIDQLCMSFTLDFLGRSMYGYEMHSVLGGSESEGAKFLHNLNLALTEFVLRRIGNPLRQWMFWDPEVQQARKAAQHLREFALRVLAHYRKTHTEEEIQKDTSLLGHILRSSVPQTEIDTAAELIDFFIGGHDTSAHTLAWTFYELSRHPEVQTELQEELDAIPGLPSTSELAKLPVLNRCLKEGMRLWPVVGQGAGRIASTAFEIGGYTIPKGSFVCVPFICLFRPSWLKDSDEFVPNRWIDPAPELEQSFMPFGAGVRKCIGVNLAYMEMRAAIAGVMKRFNLTVDTPPTLCHALTSRPGDLLLRVHRRSPANAA